MNTYKFSVKDIAEIGILVGIAIILDKFVKIPIASTGGSINIAMFPLYIIAIRHGYFKGLIGGGIVFGLITCLLDGYGLATFPLEYFVSFGVVGILGIFAKKINNLVNRNDAYGYVFSSLIILIVVLVNMVIRLFAATLDSMLLWDYEFAPAIAYNTTYIIPSAIVVGLLLIIFLPVIRIINKRFKSTYLK